MLSGVRVLDAGVGWSEPSLTSTRTSRRSTEARTSTGGLPCSRALVTSSLVQSSTRSTTSASGRRAGRRRLARGADRGGPGIQHRLVVAARRHEAGLLPRVDVVMPRVRPSVRANRQSPIHFRRSGPYDARPDWAADGPRRGRRPPPRPTPRRASTAATSTEEPLVLFHRWLADVLAAELPEPMAMVLATAPAGDQAQPGPPRPAPGPPRPAGADERGFSWVTNLRSRKGRHLAENPHAALVFPWFPLGRQVIVTGTVAAGRDDESDEYFATRPRESQLAAWASDQSEPIPDRAYLEGRWAEAADAVRRRCRCPGRRTGACSGSCPLAIEFWQQRPFRMHDRFVYERAEPGRAVERSPVWRRRRGATAARASIDRRS